MPKKTTKKKQAKKTTKKQTKPEAKTPIEMLDILDNFLAAQDFTRKQHEELVVIVSQFREILSGK